jgi:hypothetical protein
MVSEPILQPRPFSTANNAGYLNARYAADRIIDFAEIKRRGPHECMDCHRAVENQPEVSDSKPATLK